MRSKVMKEEDAEEMKQMLEAGKRLNSQLARQDSSLDVTVDIMLQAFDPKGEGNDATGYREKVQIPGGTNIDVLCGEGRRAVQAAGHATTSRTRSPWRCWTGSRPAT